MFSVGTECYHSAGVDVFSAQGGGLGGLGGLMISSVMSLTEGAEADTLNAGKWSSTRGHPYTVSRLLTSVVNHPWDLLCGRELVTPGRYITKESRGLKYGQDFFSSAFRHSATAM